MDRGQENAGFIDGAQYPFRALKMLVATPRLWGYVLIPLLINLVVGAFVYAGLLLAGWHGIDALMEALPAWMAVLDVVLRVMLVVGLLLVTGYVMLKFGVVLGSPWYERLSERMEIIRFGEAPTSGPTGVRGVLSDIGRAIGFEVKKLALALPVSVLLLVLNVIPVIGTIIAALGGVLLGTLLVALDFLDPALERRKLRFREKFAAFRVSMPASAGFGLVCLALVSIPLLNLLVVPICVAAGTLFYCDHLRPQREAERGSLSVS